MYLIFRETLNHTLLYSVDAPNEQAALHKFVLREMPNVLFNPSNYTYMLSDDLYDVPDVWYDDLNALVNDLFISKDIRFEVHAAPPLADREVADIFCSKDQIYQVPAGQIDHCLASKHQQMGLLYLSLERYNEAIREFRNSVANVSNDSVTLILLADTLARYDELLEAVRIYEQSLAHSSPSQKIDCYRAIGQIHRNLGDREKAILNFAQYLDLLEKEDKRFQQYDIDDTSELASEEDEQELQDRREIQRYISEIS